MIHNTLDKGNSIEKNIAPLLRNYCPKYEEYYSKFLVPLTGYPLDKNWRKDTHPELERIGVASFGILKSINFIFIKIEKIEVSGSPEQTFKNIYFHFGLAADSVDAVFRSIAIVESLLKIIDLEKKLIIPDDSLVSNFEKWVKKDYPKCYRQMINEGKPIFYYPQNDLNFINLIVKDKILLKRYQEMVRVIKDYRNFFIHNPGVDVFKDTTTGERFAIKKEMVRRSRNWATLRDLYSLDKSLFTNPAEMVNQDLLSFITGLDSIWSSLLMTMDLIFSHRDFPKLFRGYHRI